MARYAHEVLSNPVKYFETVEKIRRLGIKDPEGQVIRAIEASRQLEKNGVRNDYNFIRLLTLSAGFISQRWRDV